MKLALCKNVSQFPCGANKILSFFSHVLPMSHESVESFRKCHWHYKVGCNYISAATLVRFCITIAHFLHKHLRISKLLFHLAPNYHLFTRRTELLSRRKWHYRYFSIKIAQFALHRNCFIKSDLMAADSGNYTELRFYLTSAFDTVDHTILINHFRHLFGISGSVLNCFTS